LARFIPQVRGFPHTFSCIQFSSKKEKLIQMIRFIIIKEKKHELIEYFYTNLLSILQQFFKVWFVISLSINGGWNPLEGGRRK
jgi:hypothetical protein